MNGNNSVEEMKKKKQFAAEKFVYQYHYTNWPDHGNLKEKIHSIIHY